MPPKKSWGNGSPKSRFSKDGEPHFSLRSSLFDGRTWDVWDAFRASLEKSRSLIDKDAAGLKVLPKPQGLHGEDRSAVQTGKKSTWESGWRC